MEDSDSHTDSLRAEQAKHADTQSSDAGDNPMPPGSMIRGPIGHEGADDVSAAPTSAEDDQRTAEEREE